MEISNLIVIGASIAYLEAGVAIRTLTRAGVRGEPFIKDDQPVTWLGTF